MRIISNFCIVTTALLLLISSNALAKDVKPFTITIDTLSLSSAHHKDTLDILLSTDGRPVGGIVLKFGFDSPAFTIKTILAGKIPDSCDWKIFNSREAKESGTDDRPRSMWQILAMAEFGPDSLRSICNKFEQTESIARLAISIDTTRFDPPATDTFYPVFFYWENCSDNTIANSRGDSLFIAEKVDSLHWSAPEAVSVQFPSRLGASSKCIDSRAQTPPRRKIHFQNGGVWVRTVVDKNSTVE